MIDPLDHNNKSQVTQLAYTSGGSTTTTTNSFTDGGGIYLLGQVGSSVAVQGANNQTSTYSFAWYEGAEKTGAVVTGSACADFDMSFDSVNSANEAPIYRPNWSHYVAERSRELAPAREGAVLCSRSSSRRPFEHIGSAVRTPRNPLASPRHDWDVTSLFANGSYSAERS